MQRQVTEGNPRPREATTHPWLNYATLLPVDVVKISSQIAIVASIHNRSAMQVENTPCTQVRPLVLRGTSS